MRIDKWEMERLVRHNRGITPTELGELMGLAKTTVLRHAKKHNAVVVEMGSPGKKKTRLWWKYDLPDHLSSPEKENQQSAIPARARRAPAPRISL